MAAEVYLRSSDAFRPVTNRYVEPVTLPYDSVQQFIKIQKQLLFLDETYHSICNTCTESTAILDTTKYSLRTAVDSLRSLQLLDGSKAIIEAPIEMFDYYFVKNSQVQSDSVLQRRLRLYLYGGSIQSVRMIFSDLTPKQPILWKYKNKHIQARRDTLLVLSKDSEGEEIFQKRKYDQDMIAHMFPTGWQISDIVYKKKIGIHFGEDSKWDHRQAKFMDETGVMHNATEKYLLLGMGNYISAGVMESRRYSFQTPVSVDFGLITGSMLAKNVLTPLRCYQLYVDDSNKTELSVEVEVRGKEYHRDGANIMTDIIRILEPSKAGAIERKAETPFESKSSDRVQ